LLAAVVAGISATDRPTDPAISTSAGPFDADSAVFGYKPLATFNAYYGGYIFIDFLDPRGFLNQKGLTFRSGPLTVRQRA